MNDPTRTPSYPWTPSATSLGELAASIPPPAIPDHEIIKRIGRGAYGEVWLARSVTGAFRAIKVVRRESFDHARPFEREFEGILRFEPVSRSHETQVDILHVGRGEDYFYYVMELADDQATGGQINADDYHPRTLKSDLFVRSPLPFEECLAVGIALTTALEHLHQSGLVHRDVKPSNIIFVNGVAKLADIGLVTGVDMTRSYVGTEGFAAPEGPGTAQGDLFSLGKVLYEMSTGKDRQDFPELPTNLRELPEREGLLELNAVIARACRHDPRDRYPDAAAMRADLALLQSGKSLARLHRVEARLRIVRRAVAVFAALTLAALAAFWFQTTQTQEARDLAKENVRLAAESRSQLARMQVAKGNRLVEEGACSDALLWFGEALKLVKGDLAREDSHRIRLNSIVRRCPRIVQLFQHNAGVLCCEFSPDGKRIATASKDHTARVWDVTSGKPITPPLQHVQAVRSAVFSPDGAWVLTCSLDATARVWDATTGEPVSPPLKHESALVSAAFSPDGKHVLTASTGGPARVWDSVTGTLVIPEMKHEGGVSSASFSPDGRRVLTADAAGTVTIWDVNSGAPVFPQIEVGKTVSLAIFSPDGERILAATGDRMNPTDSGIVRVWSAKTGAPVTPPLLHNVAVFRGAFSPDSSRIVTATADGVARVWDARTGARIGLDLLQGSFPERAIFSPDGARVATCSQNGTARVWDAETGQPMTPPMSHASWTFCATFSPDGDSLATASEDHLVRIWDLVSGELPEFIFQDRESPRQELAAIDAQFSSDRSKVLIGTAGRKHTSARVHDAVTGKQLGSTLHEKGSVAPNEAREVLPPLEGRRLLGMAFSPDATKIVMASPDAHSSFSGSNVSVWERSEGRKLFEVAHEAVIPQTTFRPDSKYLLTISLDRTARVWDSISGEPVSPLLHHEKEIYHGSFSPDGKHVVTASVDQTAQVWEWATGQRVLPAFRHTSDVNFASYSPDGRRIVTASLDQTIRVWNAETGEPMTQPLWQVGNVAGACFSPDGRAIASWSLGPAVNVWNAETGERVLPTLDHKLAIAWAEFSLDGRLITTASLDRSARLWDAATGEALSGPLLHSGRVYKAALHAHGSRILTVSDDGVRTWRIDRLSWPVDDVVLLAHVLSGYEIDQTLSRARLSVERIVSAFHVLKIKYPEAFSAQPKQRLTWHRTQAIEAEIASNWPMALWHLYKLIEESPNDSELYARRADVRAEQRQWELARQDCAKEGDAKPQEHSQRLLLLCLKTGDKQAARELAQRLAQEAARSNNGQKRSDAAYYLCCAPDLVPEYGQIVEWAKNQPASTMAFCRTGRYWEAIESFRALDGPDSSTAPDAMYYHAMALHRLGKNEAAKEELAAANQRLEKYLALRVTERLPWQVLVVCELARQEAETLIGQRPAETAAPPN